MKVFGKVLGLFFLGFLLFVVVLGFVLIYLFDFNDYKDEICQIVCDKVNLELDLKGDIGWSLFFWLGLELYDISIVSVVMLIKLFVDLQMFGLLVWVLLLLCKDVQMSVICVEGLSLDLVCDKQGKGNWENIGKLVQFQVLVVFFVILLVVDGKGVQVQVLEQVLQNDSLCILIKFDIDSFNVNNVCVIYIDEVSGKQYNVEGIELSIGVICEGSSILLKFNVYFGINQLVVWVKIELIGNLCFDIVFRCY